MTAQAAKNSYLQNYTSLNQLSFFPAIPALISAFQVCICFVQKDIPECYSFHCLGITHMHYTGLGKPRKMRRKNNCKIIWLSRNCYSPERSMLIYVFEKFLLFRFPLFEEHDHMLHEHTHSVLSTTWKQIYTDSTFNFTATILTERTQAKVRKTSLWCISMDCDTATT